MEVVSEDPLVIIDFAHTPDGMEKVLSSFQDRNLIVIFGAGGDRDISKRPMMGAIAKKYGKHVIITSDNPRWSWVILVWTFKAKFRLSILFWAIAWELTSITK